MRFLSKAKKTGLRGVALLRLDFNTRDDWRMRAVLPTMKLLTRTAQAVVVMSHRGRPDEIGDRKAQSGKVKAEIHKFTLRKDAVLLSKLLGKKVVFVPNFDFKAIKARIGKSPRGSVFLLENMRFLKGEIEDDRALAKQLAGLGDFFVDDAFAVAHRAEASVSEVPKFLPSYAGLELEAELEHLSRVMAKPQHPLVLIIGGAKASDKLGVLRNFLDKADRILLGGGSANTMLALRGMDVKQSLRDTDPKDLRALRPLAARHHVLAPTDYVWSDDKILDIGPKSAKDFAAILAKARTIVWSGPLGMTDSPRYQKGTLAVARAITTNRKAFSLVGGGETVEFLRKHKLEKKFSFVSTGGGAMLDFLAGKKLPGVEALKR